MKKILLQLSEKSIKTLGTMIIFALIAVGAFASASPILGYIQTGNDETIKLNNQKTQITSSIARYSELKKYNTELDNVSEYLITKFPEASEVPSLIDDIAKAASDAGMGGDAISTVNVGTPTQVVEPLGEAGEALCSQLQPGDFARIIPDIKNSTAENRVYIMCSEEPIKTLSSSMFYNAATENAARGCNFSPDEQSGSKFFITVKGCNAGTILPALKANSVNLTTVGGKFPAKPILAEVTGQVAQMQISISVSSGVPIDVIAKFINNLYLANRAMSISSIKYGITTEGTSGTTITGFVFSHTRVLTAEDIATANSNNASTEGNG